MHPPEPSYRDVLRAPRILPALVPTLAARLGYGVVPLSLVLALRDRTGSFVAGGLAVSLFGLATIVMPAKARLIDRLGQRRVLPALGVGYGLALVAVVVAPPVASVALCTLAGVVAPPVGPAMRARWAQATSGRERERAFALDTVLEESLYVLGPVVAGVTTAWDPAAGVLIAAGFGLVGAVGLGVAPGAPSSAADPATEPAHGPDARTAPHGRGLPPGLVALLIVAAGFGVGTSALELVVTARAVAAGRDGWAGGLIGAFVVGSVVGGVVWGRRRHRRGPGVHLTGLLVWIALGAVVTAAVPFHDAAGGIVLGAALLLTGLAVSPTLIVVYLAVDARTDPDRRTEANTWTNTASNLGGAAGAGVAGVLVTALGARPVALLVAAPLLLATVAALRVTVPVSADASRTGRG